MQLRFVPVPLIAIPLIAVAKDVAFAFRWWRYLLRERQAEH